jgi:hypothetical protein
MQSLGEFPLLPVEPFSKNLPENIKKRGGFFLPMYQREALWIRLPYPSKTGGAFKIAVGGKTIFRYNFARGKLSL